MLNIVVSGVNMVEGGILRILRDALKALVTLKSEYKLSVTVLVHNVELVKEFEQEFNIIPFPEIKTSWRKRLMFEYVTSKKLSKKLKPDLWISLHDMTPNVVCPVQVVYCHNPSPFYNEPIRRFWRYDRTFALFTLFYKYLYQINIRKNKYVIVQQDWIRKAFKEMYGVDSIVAYPKFVDQQPANLSNTPLVSYADRPVFFFPSFPRVFKNFECVCKAAEILSKTNPDFELIITIESEENKYASKIYHDYQHVKQIKFIGLQSHQQIEKIYLRADCLVFASKLETWGLPLSEFMVYNKPVLAADLPYAHETLGAYKMANYFNPDTPEQLSAQMLQVINGRFTPQHTPANLPEAPFFESWVPLLKFLATTTKQVINHTDNEGPES